MNIVKELRKKSGIQQKELAIIANVSRPTVSEWEANKKDPSGDRLKKLADFFGVDELTILGKYVIDLSQDSSEQAPAVDGDLQRMITQFSQLSPSQKQQILDYTSYLLSKHAQ